MKVIRKLEFKTVDGSVYSFSDEEWSWAVDSDFITLQKGRVQYSEFHKMEVPCPEVVKLWFPLCNVVWLKVTEDTVD